MYQKGRSLKDLLQAVKGLDFGFGRYVDLGATAKRLPGFAFKGGVA